MRPSTALVRATICAVVATWISTHAVHATDLYATNSANAEPKLVRVGGSVETLADNTDGLNACRQIAVRADGTVLIANALADVSVYDPVTGTTSPFSSVPSQPNGIAVSSTGTVYVSDTGNASVYALDGTTGTGPAILDDMDLGSPRGLAVDANDTLYIADPLDGKIYSWTSTGGLTELSSDVAQPEGLAFSPDGVLFATNGNPAGVWEVAANGTGTEVLSSTDGIGSPRQLAFDSSGVLFIADALGGDILQWSGTGSPTQVIASIGTTSQPHGLAVVPPLFADGFESGDVTRWTTSVP